MYLWIQWMIYWYRSIADSSWYKVQDYRFDPIIPSCFDISISFFDTFKPPHPEIQPLLLQPWKIHGWNLEITQLKKLKRHIIWSKVSLVGGFQTSWFSTGLVTRHSNNNDTTPVSRKSRGASALPSFNIPTMRTQRSGVQHWLIDPNRWEVLRRPIRCRMYLGQKLTTKTGSWLVPFPETNSIFAPENLWLEDDLVSFWGPAYVQVLRLCWF